MAVNSSNAVVTQFLRTTALRNNPLWVSMTTFISHGARALTPAAPSPRTWTAANGLQNIAQVGIPTFPYQVDHYFELHYLAVVFHYTVANLNNPHFDETDLEFVASIANMPENLYNLATAFHRTKTNYFGERRLVSLTQNDPRYIYLIAAAPIFRAAIDARHQALIIGGIYAGFKIDFLNSIMDTPFYHGDWDNYFIGQPNAVPANQNPQNPQINIWCY